FRKRGQPRLRPRPPPERDRLPPRARAASSGSPGCGGRSPKRPAGCRGAGRSRGSEGLPGPRFHPAGEKLKCVATNAKSLQQKGRSRRTGLSNASKSASFAPPPRSTRPARWNQPTAGGAQVVNRSSRFPELLGFVQRLELLQRLVLDLADALAG